MAQEAGDERAGRLGELIFGARLVEGVLVALEKRDVGVHARAGVFGEGLGHERRPDALFHRDFLHHEAEAHDVVRGGQRVGVAQVDLLLARCALVVAVLDGDPHRLEHRDRLAAEVVRERVRCVVVIAARVDRDRDGADLWTLADQEELDLRVRVEGEAHVRRLGQVALEHPARIGVARGAVGEQDVAEHAGHAGVLTAPRQQLKRRRVGPGDHVGLVYSREALDGASVEADAVREGALELRRGDGHRLEHSEHVREPEPDETNITLFERAEHEFFLPIHGYHLNASRGHCTVAVASGWHALAGGPATLPVGVPAGSFLAVTFG
jgi:hypothetical protein